MKKYISLVLVLSIFTSLGGGNLYADDNWEAASIIRHHQDGRITTLENKPDIHGTDYHINNIPERFMIAANAGLNKEEKATSGSKFIKGDKIFLAFNTKDKINLETQIGVSATLWYHFYNDTNENHAFAEADKTNLPNHIVYEHINPAGTCMTKSGLPKSVGNANENYKAADQEFFYRENGQWHKYESALSGEDCTIEGFRIKNPHPETDYNYILKTLDTFEGDAFVDSITAYSTPVNGTETRENEKTVESHRLNRVEAPKNDYDSIAGNQHCYHSSLRITVPAEPKTEDPAPTEPTDPKKNEEVPEGPKTDEGTGNGNGTPGNEPNNNENPANPKTEDPAPTEPKTEDEGNTGTRETEPKKDEPPVNPNTGNDKNEGTPTEPTDPKKDEKVPEVPEVENPPSNPPVISSGGGSSGGGFSSTTTSTYISNPHDPIIIDITKTGGDNNENPNTPPVNTTTIIPYIIPSTEPHTHPTIVNPPKTPDNTTPTLENTTPPNNKDKTNTSPTAPEKNITLSGEATETETKNLNQFKKFPKYLPQTGVENSILQYFIKTKSKSRSIETNMRDEDFRLAGNTNTELSHWLQVLPEQDQNLNKYLVIPSTGLVIPINNVSETDKSYNNFLNGKSENFHKYLENGSVELPGSKFNGYGEAGNKVIGGHSSFWKKSKSRYKTHFQSIIGLEKGTEIWVYQKNESGKFDRFVYKTTDSYNTKPTDTSILKQTDHSQLTLFTCTPIGGVQGRWIVKSEFVGKY